MNARTAGALSCELKLFLTSEMEDSGKGECFKPGKGETKWARCDGDQGPELGCEVSRT